MRDQPPQSKGWGINSVGKRLDRAFNPRTVAVVGDKRAMGYLWLRALSTFQGKVYSVQIDPNELPGIQELGVPNYESLSAIPDEVDYVVCAVPRSAAPKIVADCIAKKVTAVTLFTSGFAETEEAEGVRLQKEIGDLAWANGLLLIGPNCMGIYNPSIGLRHSFEQPSGQAGNVGFISQSGTHCINFSLVGHRNGIRCSKTVSFGNAEVLDASDYLEYLANDADTEVIGLYLEGVPARPGKDGRRTFQLLRATTPRKPIVVWKGGQTAAGARAVYSHTASLAASPLIWQAALRQAGAISTDSLDETIEVIKALLYCKAGSGRRMGLIAMTGGQSVVITDAFEREGLEVPLLSSASYEKLSQFFNIIGGSYRNPLDAGGTIGMGANAANLQRMLAILDEDANVDAIALEVGAPFLARRLQAQPGLLDALIEIFASFKERSSKPLIAIVHPGHVEEIMAEIRSKLTARGIPTFASFQAGARALRKVIEYWRFRQGQD